MTDLFKPTFLRMGVPFNKARPPTSITPPTSSGAATVAACAGYSSDGVTDTTQTWDIPSGAASGDLLVVFIRTETGAGLSTPSGWTKENEVIGGSGDTLVVYTKTASGTDPGTTVNVTNDQSRRWASVCAAVRNPGSATVTLSGFGDGTTEVSAVTPSQGAGTYIVIEACGYNNSSSPSITPSTNYTELCEVLAGVGSRQMLTAYRNVDITTSEDPDAMGTGSSSGPQTVCVAVLATTEPEVAAGDHTHTEDEVDDITTLTQKATPVVADRVKIYDSEASDVNKWAELGDLPGGASDHGALTGLADDDHTQYFNTTRHDADDHSAVDHGGILGLSDDDHTQYLLAAGTRAATYLEVSGLTGATGSSPRFVGGTTTGAPASGTFALGDYVVTEDGNIYVCTTAGSPGTWTAVGAGAATDANAIHDDTANEISAITEKVTPVSGDLLIIEDSAASYVKKKVQIGNLPSSGGSTVPDWVEHLATPDDSPNAADEFDNASIGATNITTTGTVTWTESRGLLSVKVIASSMTASDLDMQVIALSGGATSSPVTIESRANLWAPGGTTAPRWFVGFTDGTTSAANIVGVSGTNSQINRSAGTVTAIGSELNLGSASGGVANAWLYVRVVWVSSNTFQIQVSPDGVTWTNMGTSSHAITITPTHFGVGVAGWAHGEDVIASFEYLRVYESDLSV